MKSSERCICAGLLLFPGTGTYAQGVNDALDNTLNPGARNEELKALLVKVRRAHGMHDRRSQRVGGGDELRARRDNRPRQES